MNSWKVHEKSCRQTLYSGRNELRTFKVVIGAVDPLLIDRRIMEKVREQKRNLAVDFCDYQQVYDMLRHGWMKKAYRWTRVPEKVFKVIKTLIEGWKTD